MSFTREQDDERQTVLARVAGHTSTMLILWTNIDLQQILSVDFLKVITELGQVNCCLSYELLILFSAFVNMVKYKHIYHVDNNQLQ